MVRFEVQEEEVKARARDCWESNQVSRKNFPPGRKRERNDQETRIEESPRGRSRRKKQKTEVPVDEKEKKLKELEKKERKAAEKTELDKLREKDNPSFQTGLSKKDKEVMKTRAKSPRKAPAPIVEKDFMEEK